jgi:hypothetical protein
MLHLVQYVINPRLGLKECVEDWHGISCALRESPRQRGLQVEKFDNEDWLLS